MNDTRPRALAVLPWLVLFVFLALLVAMSLARRHGLLVVLVPVWLLATVVLRKAVGRFPERAGRLLADGAFGVVCFLLGSFGGWFVLPAVLAFVAADAVAPTGAGTVTWKADGRAELLLGVATLAAAAVMTAVVVGTPLFGYAWKTISSPGEVTESTGSSGLPLITGLVFFMAPAAVVLLGAIREYRRPGTGRALIGLVAVVLTVLSVLGGFSIGMYLMPIAVLSVATFAAAGSRTPQGG